MNPTSTEFADRVWQDTLPALQRRRTTRRAFGSGVAALLLAVLTVILWPTDLPAEYQWITAYETQAQGASPPSPSLAVLVVDQAGTRFRELRPEEITDRGLNLNLTLEPVITSRVGDPYYQVAIPRLSTSPLRSPLSTKPDN